MPPGARVLVAGGGTGGHAIPALAIAEAIRRRDPGARFLFLGTGRGVEARVVPAAGFRLEPIAVIGLKRTVHPDLIRFPFVLLRGFAESLAAVRAFGPDAVVCTGGYVSGPVGLAARVLGFPLVLHEQNVLPGLTARLLSRTASRTFSAFPGALPRLGGRRREAAGCPLRERPEGIDPGVARQRFGLDPDRPTLLVMGGSQGARAINEALLDALPALLKGGDIQVLWQTGSLDYERMAGGARGHGDRAAAAAFIEDTASAYSAADLALTRAGAMTLAELNLFGLPAVLVPLPTSAENHQEINARAMERAGWAKVLLQRDLSPRSLARAVTGLLRDDSRRLKMAETSRARAVTGAADRIAAAVLELAGGRR